MFLIVEVFNSYDATIGLSKLSSKEEVYELSLAGNIDIDNRGNKEELIRIEIISNLDTTVINSISNGEKTITFSSGPLLTSQLMVLDFKEQIYQINSTSIVNELTLDGLLALKENEITTFKFDFTGHIDVKFIFDQYQEDEDLHYVEQFSIVENKNYNESKPYYSNKIKQRKVNNIKYDFSISKLSTKWIDTDTEYRISYYCYNQDIYYGEWKYIIGVIFDNVEQKAFNNPNDIFKDTISGNGMDIITRNY